jgi:hypothetical protein
MKMTFLLGGDLPVNRLRKTNSPEEAHKRHMQWGRRKRNLSHNSCVGATTFQPLKFKTRLGWGFVVRLD